MRSSIFAAVAEARGRDFDGDQAGVDILDAALDQLGVARDGAAGDRTVNMAAIELMHGFEGLALKAYPDPGSRDGSPWTIGRGATGPGIVKGLVWTEAQANDRFAADLQKFAKGVETAIGKAPTTDNQFGALVSLAYNIGLGALKESTLLRLHKEGNYTGAAGQFARWNKNDGAVMAGLTRRRAAEAALYRRSA